VFQIDGNLGAIAGISEMLLQSHDDAISILPALPSTWSSGSFFGLRARGGTTVGATWSQGRLETITLRGTPGAAVDVETHDEIEWQRESQSPTPSLKSQNPRTHRARWEVRLADEGSRHLSPVGIR
jgi:alpha-L-fucosidase 2